MYGEDRLVSIGYALNDLPDGFAKLMRDRVAYGIRDIDGARAGINSLLNDAAEEVDLGTAAIFTGELHITTQVAGALDRMHGLFDHLIRWQAQLVFHMNGAGGNEGVDTSGVGIDQGFGSSIDIRIHCPGQTAHGAVLDGLGNTLYRFEVAGASNREAGFNHVHPQFFQCLGDPQLLFPGHGCTRALLAIAQGGIENDDAILIHLPASWVIQR